MTRWIPAENILTALGHVWPESLAGLARWAIDDSTSVYRLLETREVIETLIRGEALDERALANIVIMPTLPPSYQAAPIATKMAALTQVNHHIAKLGLDKYADVTPIVSDSRPEPSDGDQLAT